MENDTNLNDLDLHIHNNLKKYCKRILECSKNLESYIKNSKVQKNTLEISNIIINNLTILTTHLQFISELDLFSLSSNDKNYLIKKMTEDIRVTFDSIRDFDFTITGIKNLTKPPEDIHNTMTSFLYKLNAQTNLIYSYLLNYLLNDIYALKFKYQHLEDIAMLYQNQTNDINNYQNLANDCSNLIKSHKDELENLKKLSSSYTKKFATAYEIASKTGLAQSFYKRSEELQEESRKWLNKTIIAFGCLVGLVIFHLLTTPNLSSFDFNDINTYLRASILHAPMFVAVFWILWFCTKQYFYICHLRDDYRYKFDLSMAFNGYNQEAKALSQENVDLRINLLKNVIYNISKNPVDEKFSNCHSPYAEMIDSIKEAIIKRRD